MAVRKDITRVNLRVVVTTGTDMSTGKPIRKNRGFGGVRLEVSPNDAMDVMQSVMSLQKHQVYNYIQVDTSELIGVPE